MSILFSRRASTVTGPDPGDIPPRPVPRPGTVAVTKDTALRHSAVWACLRLRANLISTMPVDVYRKVGGVSVEVPKPPVLITPGGERVKMHEWLFSTQFDLDRAGNAIGLITARDGLGLPARIELQSLDGLTLRKRKGVLKYVIGGKEYDPPEVWHEKQYTVAGLEVGLSPIAYAAWSISEYLSIQEFALDWFGAGGIPAAQLRNTAKTVDPDDADAVKDRFKAATAHRDLFVTGTDWEYKPIQSEETGNAWIEAKNFGIGDIARFLDCPGDLIDAAVSTGSITYASITQRNLQFLIMHLGPAVFRRETALSDLTSRPRFVKLNANALLRMDPAARALALKTRIDSRTLTPDEARQLEDMPPLTEDQMAQFDRLFGGPKTPPTPTAPDGTEGGTVPTGVGT